MDERESAVHSFELGVESFLRGAQAAASVSDERGVTTPTLDMALKAVSDKWASDWSPREPIIKLIYLFCQPDLKEPLETIRFLAEKTKDIENVLLSCVQEGEVVRLAALLMGAWNRLVPPNVEECRVGQHIWRQIAHLSNEELKLMIDCGPNCELLEGLKSKKINLVSQWKLLTELEKLRDVVKEYPFSLDSENLSNHEVPFDVAYNELFTCTESVMKPDDMLSGHRECLRPKPTTVEKDRSEVNLEKDLSVRSMISSFGERPSGGKCCTMLSRSSSSARPYHTWGDLNMKIGKIAEKSVARNNPKIWVSSAKICGRLILCAKRIMK